MSAGVDESTIVDLSNLEDFDVPCDVKLDTGECESPSKWFAITSCCGGVAMLCDEHKDTMRMLIKRNEVSMCYFCGRIGKYGELIMSIEPL